MVVSNFERDLQILAGLKSTSRRFFSNGLSRCATRFLIQKHHTTSTTHPLSVTPRWWLSFPHAAFFTEPKPDDKACSAMVQISISCRRPWGKNTENNGHLVISLETGNAFQCINIRKHTQDASRLSRAEAAMQCLAWGDACCRSEWNSMLHSEAKRCHTSIESEGTYYKTCQIISNHMMIIKGIESLYFWVSVTLHRFERAMALGLEAPSSKYQSQAQLIIAWKLYTLHYPQKKSASQALSLIPCHLHKDTTT